MQAMICDRCGRFIPKNTETGEYEGQTIVVFKQGEGGVYFGYPESVKVKKDICDACAEDFQRWLNDESALVKEFNESLNALKRLKEAKNA